MKTIETITYGNTQLTVLIETKEDEKKAFVSYFINGIEITEWSKLVKRYQATLTVLADNMCEGMGLIKWSY